MANYREIPNWGAYSLLLLGLFVATSAAADRDLRIVVGLRDRQLFDLAEAHARRQLASDKLSPLQRTDLMVEVIRTLALQAANAPDEEQDRRWNAAQKGADQFLNASPPPVRAELIRVQQLLAGLAQGELARLTWEARNEESLAETARQQLRSVRRQLEDLQKDLEHQIIARRGRQAAEEELASEELSTLGNNLTLHQARLLRNMALTYPPEADSRLALLVEGIELLKGPLRQLTRDDPLYLQMSVEWLIAARLSGKAEEAQDFLRGLLARNLPPDLRLRLYAEGVRLSLAQQNLEQAGRLVQLGGQLAGSLQSDPEFDFAKLELDVARWQNALREKDASQTNQWQSTSLATARELEQRYGPYWGRRADHLLIATAPSSGVNVAADVLRRSAENLYRQGQLAEAVAVFEKSAEQASKQGDENSRFDLLYKAAAIQQNRKDFADAARRMQTISIALPHHVHAAEAHLLAAWNYAQAARAVPTELAQYESALAEHLQHWPNNPSSVQVRLWQGQLWASQGKWSEAAAVLAAIPTDSPHFAEALTAIIPAWNRAAELRKSQGSSSLDELVTSAGEYYRGIILDHENAWPANWSPSQRDAAVAWGRLLIDFRPASLPDAQRVLTAARQGLPAPDKDWQREADALLVAILAAQPTQRNEATQLLQQLAGVSPTELLDLLKRLSDVAGRSSAEVQKSVAELQLQTVELLQPQLEKLSAERRRDVQRVQASALAAVGKRDEARRVFAEVAATAPQDGALQEEYALFLAADDDASAIVAALAQWRRVASKTKPQTDRWYRAKLAIADLLRRQGDKPAAAQLIRYLLETPPGIDASWRPRFEALLRQCE